MKHRNFLLSGALFTYLLAGSTGCELITKVDRSTIDNAPAGLGGAGGSGGCTPIDDGNECTDDVCNTDGTTAHNATASGAECSKGGSQCDGAGQCVECIVANDCPGTDDECQTRTCTAGACGFDFIAADTQVGMQTTGDCKVKVCNGTGGIIDNDDDADISDDNNPCTTDTCSMGTSSSTNLPLGTGCGMTGNGDPLVCNDMGQCIGCNTAADCGTNDECKTYTCTAGVCGTDFTTANSPVAAQTGNNCLVHVCDGSGNFVDIPDDADVPLDDGNACTDETCAAGMPMHPNVADGSMCDDSDACTQTDACQMGTCTGANPVTCMASDQCHDIGMCDAMTGLCSDPAKMDGSSCDDSNACTQTDACQIGVCTGANPVMCMALDDCHLVGTCNSTNGMCDDPTAPDGTTCMSGTATGTCSVGACDLCGNNAVDAGEQCDDGNKIDGDGCSADCLSDESCGNMIFDTAAGETCDDGNVIDGDGCSATCVAEPFQICSTNVPVSIVDNMTIMSALNLGFPYQISSIDVELDITHSSLDDLTINLSHGASTVLIADNFDNQMGPGNACTGDDMTVILDDEASADLEGACVEPGTPAINGRFRPKGTLADFVGANAASGNWTLSVADANTGDAGSIDRWCLNLNGFGVSTVPARVYWMNFNASLWRVDADGANATQLNPSAGGSAIATDPVTNTIFYNTGAAINRAADDGTNPVTIVANGGSPAGLAVDSLNGKVYWADFNNDRIGRANLDGTNQEIVVTGINDPSGVALDVPNSKAYVITYNNTILVRFNFDGTGLQTIVPSVGGQGIAVAVDSNAGKMYYSTRANDIYVANVDGTNVTTLVTGQSAVQGLAIDVAAGLLYWSQPSSQTIRSANLADGSNIQNVSPSSGNAWHVAVMPAP